MDVSKFYICPNCNNKLPECNKTLHELKCSAKKPMEMHTNNKVVHNIKFNNGTDIKYNNHVEKNINNKNKINTINNTNKNHTTQKTNNTGSTKTATRVRNNGTLVIQNQQHKKNNK